MDKLASIENSLNEFEARAILDNILQHKNATSWTRDQENLIVQWAKRCENFKVMHRLSSQHYNRMNTLLSYPVVIVSSVIGISGFAIIKYEKPTIHEIVLQYIFSTGNMIISILSSLSKFQNYIEKSEQHHQAFSRYGKLCRLIRIQMSLVPESRRDAYQFIDELRDEFDKLADIGLSIPSHVRSKFDYKSSSEDFQDTRIHVRSSEEIVTDID